MDELWENLGPLLGQLWQTLISITMICVDAVLGFVAERVDEPLETWEPYVWVHDNEGLTTGILLFLIFLIIRGRRSPPAPQPATPARPAPVAARSSSQSSQPPRPEPSRPSPASCSHDWKFTHKGVDKNFPRGHYTCRKCDVHGIEETFGDGRIVAQR